MSCFIAEIIIIARSVSNLLYFSFAAIDGRIDHVRKISALLLYTDWPLEDIQRF